MNTSQPQNRPKCVNRNLAPRKVHTEPAGRNNTLECAFSSPALPAENPGTQNRNRHGAHDASFSPEECDIERWQTICAPCRRRSRSDPLGGTVVNRPASSNDPIFRIFYGQKPLVGWKAVIDKVHAAAASWLHTLAYGVVAPHASGWLPPAPFEGPSGLVAPGKVGAWRCRSFDIAKTTGAFAQAAASAKVLGLTRWRFMGPHGYLIDQFFWHPTNQRTMVTVETHWRNAADSPWNSFRAVRKAVGPDFVISLRASQWKLQRIMPPSSQPRRKRWRHGWGRWRSGRGYLPLFAAPVLGSRIRRFRFLNFAGWAKKTDRQDDHYRWVHWSIQRFYCRIPGRDRDAQFVG